MSAVDARGIVLCLVLAALAGCQRRDVPAHGRPENALRHDEVVVEHEITDGVAAFEVTVLSERKCDALVIQGVWSDGSPIMDALRTLTTQDRLFPPKSVFHLTAKVPGDVTVQSVWVIDDRRLMILLKVISFAGILATGLVGGLLSVGVGKTKGRKRAFALGNAFAGGIFLGAGLIHMLPGAIAGFEHFSAHPHFPWASTICCAGFLLVLLIEQVLFRGHDAIAASAKDGAETSVTPYVMTLVLSVHSIIAGIALGTEVSLATMVVILIAIVAHKGSAAFALGVSLSQGGFSSRRVMRVVTLFSFTTPIGILLGSLLSAMLRGATEVLAASVFSALAAGTFLYVATLHILAEVFETSEDKGVKFALATLGLAIMAGVKVWIWIGQHALFHLA